MINFLSYEKLESFLSNLSFVALFFSMMAYWIQTSGGFIKSSKTPQTSSISMPVAFADNKVNPGLSKSITDYSSNFSENNQMLMDTTLKSSNPNQVVSNGNNSMTTILQKKNRSFDAGHLGMLGANLSLLALLSLRWIESGHFPLSNLYESLMFLSWALTFFHLVLEKMTTNTLTWLGAMTSPTALFTNAFANFSLPAEMQHSSALVPALQSNWLMMHVTVMILSYAALIFGSLLSIGFLILTLSVSSEQYEKSLKTEKASLLVPNIPNSKLEWAQNLDNLSYRMLGIGFPLLTIGILSGAVWANEAWGSYWSWDPKETWALLTWLVFAIYLHTRITKNWQGKNPAMIASFGFFVVWICYLGVNLLGEGLHSYGWLQS